jgi:predicted Zn-dependent protease
MARTNKTPKASSITKTFSLPGDLAVKAESARRIKTRTANKNFSDKEVNQHLQKQMNRVLAKLEGFIDEPNYLLTRYKNRNDESANYVKSIALFRKGKIDESLKILDEIISKKSLPTSNANQSLGFLFDYT